MTSVVRTRGPRAEGPEWPAGEIELQEPPELPEAQPADMASLITMVPMALGSGAMMMMFASPAAGPTMYIAAGMMGVSSVGMLAGQLVRPGIERKRRMNSERRDYMRYLAQVRKKVRRAAQSQREALLWTNPEPTALWGMVAGDRLWERRPTHDDFGEVRIATGRLAAALRLIPPTTKPLADLEPLSALALRRFITTHSTVDRLPVGLRLGAFPVVAVRGTNPEQVRGLVRAMLAQLVVFHAPDNIRLALIADDQHAPEWEWMKWLPHARHPTMADAAGQRRLYARQPQELLDLLGPTFLDRPGFDPNSTVTPDEPMLIVIADEADYPADYRLLLGGLRNVVLLDIRLGETACADDADDPDVAIAAALTLDVRPDGLESVIDGVRSGLGRPDQYSRAWAESLARSLSPLRSSTTGDGVESLQSSFDVTRLLGIGDARAFDVTALWRGPARRDHLRVPIGVGRDGQIVELDIKESAQGGMGPHGVLIGATGSGKSELLRTLVITLAATHSSEHLNFVLVDFKGGATFLGLDALSHTSAVITNLADELPLVDRMQDSLHGELVRRQELLRRAGHSSLKEYEKARAEGAQLAALPSLLVVVDEFSELLATKPEFVDLFVMIGRLGRSLGVHLLLASQRLDDGRIHQLESHLSYRIALRTFSAMESRSIIGVADAYELPSDPGHGYLKIDTTTLVRFKAGYVSGPYEPETVTVDEVPPYAHHEVVPFTSGFVARPAAAVPQTVSEEQPEAYSGTQTLLEVLTRRLADHGPKARQVWMPPLGASPSLDMLLPGIVPHRDRGLTAASWPGSGRLRVPVGLIDRPFEQRRDLLTADLSGAAGHIAIVGAPQSGKSTMLRTLIMSLSVTHTPREVQFYCLDFGGGALSTIAGLPHVGSVASRRDRDRVKRTVAEISQLLQQREQAFTEHGIDSMAAYRKLCAAGTVNDRYGEVFLVVDGWFTLRQDYDEFEARITELATIGLGYGLHVVITASRWSEIRPSLRDLLGTRFELRLGDPLESEVGSRAAATVPAVPGRGLTSGGLHFVAALPRLDLRTTSDDIGDAVTAAVGEIDGDWTGPRAPGVRLLPTRLPAERLSAPVGNLRVPIGWDEDRLAEVVHDFSAVPHLLVFGDAETGKTNLLRLIAKAVTDRYTAKEAGFILGDFGRKLGESVPEEYRLGYAVTGEALADLVTRAATSLEKRLPGPDVTAEQLARRDWWSGRRLFVLVDDYDLVSSGAGGVLEPLVPLLAHGADIGLHLVLARSSSGAMRAMLDPALRRMWELGSHGLLFSYPKEEGKFLGEAQPRQLPVGRAQLVTRRSISLVQTAVVDSGSEDTGGDVHPDSSREY